MLAPMAPPPMMRTRVWGGRVLMGCAGQGRAPQIQPGGRPPRHHTEPRAQHRTTRKVRMRTCASGIATLHASTANNPDADGTPVAAAAFAGHYAVDRAGRLAYGNGRARDRMNGLFLRMPEPFLQIKSPSTRSNRLLRPELLLSQRIWCLPYLQVPPVWASQPSQSAVL